MEQENESRLVATALGYVEGEDFAPVVLASGRGKIAEQILAIASANGIPIQQDSALAEALAKINISEVIPPELYLVVAEIFSYIYRIRKNISHPQG